MTKLQHDTYLVVGLAKSGRAVARLLAVHGANVVLFDDDTSRLSLDVPEYDGVREQMVVAPSADPSEWVGRVGCVVLSPGVPLDHPVVRAARDARVEITGELDVSYRFCSADIVAVTGTNGKSTVVSLLGDIFEAAGRRVVVAGNIGTPLAAVVTDMEDIEIAVLEVSSFQLDTIKDFKSHVAVLLNVTADHLDRYDDSFDRYAASKSRILMNSDRQTWFVYNFGDEVCRRIADGHQGNKMPFGGEVSGDGVYVQNGAITRRWNGRVETVISISDFTPVGIHNLENAMAAVAAVAPFDVDADSVRAALKAYRPLPHRMEIVRVSNGVTYINDSKATNVDAAIKSIRSVDGKLILVAGGLGKGSDFGPIGDHMSHVKIVILIGDASDEIASVLDGKADVIRASSMEDAVTQARGTAKSGDTVLLAPACASFDMFRDYKDRGDAFRTAVEKL